MVETTKTFRMDKVTNAKTGARVNVDFSVWNDGRVCIVTLANYCTRYTHSVVVSKEEARAEWKRLRADGFRPIP